MMKKRTFNIDEKRKETKKMLTEKEITVQCLNCNKIIKMGEPPLAHISHGYCEECYQQAIAEIKKEK